MPKEQAKSKSDNIVRFPKDFKPKHDCSPDKAYDMIMSMIDHDYPDTETEIQEVVERWISPRDQKAFLDEAFFKKCYGRALGQASRSAFLKLKNRLNLTERQMRILLLANLIHESDRSLAVKRVPLIAWLGWVQITPLAIFTVACLILLIVAPDLTYVTFAYAVGFSLVLGTLIALSYRSLIYPEVLCKKVTTWAKNRNISLKDDID